MEITLFQEIMKKLIFAVPTWGYWFHAKHNSHIFRFFSFFMMENHFFFKIFRKIRKSSSISPVAWDSGKTKLLSRYFRLKSWKSVNSSISLNSIIFIILWFLVKKSVFLVFSDPSVTFTHFGWRNADTKSRFQPGAGNGWKWAHFN